MNPTPVAAPPQQSYSLPLVAFILSLLGLCICPTAVVGAILGVVALVRIGREPWLPGKGFAIAALLIPLALVPIVGIQAAIAIPNFIKFQARSKQGECKANLRGMYAAQKAAFAEDKAYAATFAELDFQPEPGNRYSYFLSPEAVAPVDAVRFPQERAELHGLELSQRHLRPGSSGETLLMACVGNVDNDATLDVWTVDESGVPLNVVNDVTE